jgi:predicted MFS family arabinose efflux permease
VRTLLGVATLFGLGIACFEVGLAAFASERGHPSAVGFLFACSGLGSMIGGALAARSRPPADGTARLTLLLAAGGLLAVPWGLVHGLGAMAVAVAVGSLAIAPSLALVYALISEVSPAGGLTEAMTWLSSLINLGLAAGSALAGFLVEHVSTTLVLFGFAAYGAFAAAVVAWRASTLAT